MRLENSTACQVDGVRVPVPVTTGSWSSGGPFAAGERVLSRVSALENAPRDHPSITGGQPLVCHLMRAALLASEQ